MRGRLRSLRLRGEAGYSLVEMITVMMIMSVVFAGKAFRWQDAPTPLELPDATPVPARVFSVIPSSSDGVIGFTRGGA